MNKKEFIKCVTTLLRENDIKKPITIPKQVYTISDNEGNSKSFSIQKKDKREAYTLTDVSRIIDACIAIVKDQLKKGEPVEFYGIGSLGVHYRKPRDIKNVDSGEAVTVEGRYVPKFKFGNELRMCARVYGMSLDDRAPEIEPFYSDDDFADNPEDGDS